ncbi:hypothetical protein, partial [Mesorhizobium sp.]|uniref:hypothetical protein n=1 Tax=Mesorhizobium sp. TaxID=1871066 RepID=UPI00257A4990
VLAVARDRKSEIMIDPAAAMPMLRKKRSFPASKLWPSECRNTIFHFCPSSWPFSQLGPPKSNR